MGGCVCAQSRQTSTSQTSTQIDYKKQNLTISKTKNQLTKSKKSQNNQINQWLTQFRGIEQQIDIFKQQLLQKMEHQKMYRNWTLDKLFSECYYRNLKQSDELFTLSRNIKELSQKLETLIQKSSEKDCYEHANSELVEELNFCIKGFTPFVETAQNLPLIPEIHITSIKSISEIVPALSASQTII